MFHKLWFKFDFYIVFRVITEWQFLFLRSETTCCREKNWGYNIMDFTYRLGNACEITSTVWLFNAFFEQMTLKNIKLMKIVIDPQKRTTSIYEVRSVYDLKRKRCPYNVGMIRLIVWNHIKTQFCTLKYPSLKIVLGKNNLLFPATKVPNRWCKFSPKLAHPQSSVPNLCRNWIKFPFAWSDVQLQKKPKTLFMILQSLQFILFWVQKLILYQTVVTISRRLFLLLTFCT